MEETKYAHIQAAVNFCDLIRSTLGPRGMNKAVINKSNNNTIFTNDGATIIEQLNINDPIVNLFKELAKSQEKLVGDGTSTTVILAGQLLDNALSLLNKGIHPTTIINGYSIAKVEVMKKLDELKSPGEVEKIIKTAFGSKITQDIVEVLKKLIMKVKDYEKLKIHKQVGDPLDSKIFNGYIFDGYMINDRMKGEVDGKIVVLDYRTNVAASELKIEKVDELKKINEYEREYKRDIVDKLVEKGVDCIFYTDTNPEFETYLTEKKISGVVVFQRDILDGICAALDLTATSNIENIYLADGHVRYEKPNQIYVDGKVETLILKGPTIQNMDELGRVVDDVVSLLKHEIDQVVGAGAIEIELAQHLYAVSKSVGGKEQLAIEKFAESLESIPLIIAENCGLDAIMVLTALKTMHKENPNLGVDMMKGMSDALERGIVEPVLVKIHAINSAANVANLILKTDKLLVGEK